MSVYFGHLLLFAFNFARIHVKQPLGKTAIFRGVFSVILDFSRVGSNVYIVGYDRLQFPGLSWRVSDISNMSDISQTSSTLNTDRGLPNWKPPSLSVCLVVVTSRPGLYCYHLVRKYLPACHCQVSGHHFITDHRTILTVLERKPAHRKQPQTDLVTSCQDRKSSNLWSQSQLLLSRTSLELNRTRQKRKPTRQLQQQISWEVCWTVRFHFTDSWI